MKRFCLVFSALLVFAACASAQPTIQGNVTLQMMTIVDPAVVGAPISATTGPDILIVEFFFSVKGARATPLLVKLTTTPPGGAPATQSLEFTTEADSPYPSMISFWIPRGNTLGSVSFAEVRPLAAFALRQ